MSLHLFVARTQMRKTWEAKHRAQSRIPALMYSPPQKWSPDPLWPVVTLDALRAEQEKHKRGRPRVTLDADCAEFLDVLESNVHAGYLRAVVLDEVHDFFDAGEAPRRVLKGLLRQHRHGGAEWYACTQRFVGIAELTSVADVVTVGSLLSPFDARTAAQFDWPGRRLDEGLGAFPEWAADIPLEELVLDLRICRSLVECDTRVGRLTWLQCDCLNHKDKDGKVLSCSAPR